MNTANPILTVVISAFNAEGFLTETIESVLSQSFQEFELVIINDGSTDRTGQICDRFAAKDLRVRIVHQPNKGMAFSRNAAINECTSEFIAIMDADDIMLPHRLERQLEFMKQHRSVGAASCRTTYIDDQGNTLGTSANQMRTFDKFHKLMERQEVIALMHPGAIFRRQAFLDVGGYRGQYWPADDADLTTRIAENGYDILVQDEILMLYRVHSSSAISSNFLGGRMKYEWVRASMRARRAGLPEPTWDEFTESWSAAPVLQRLNRGRKAHAKRLYRKAGFDLISKHWGSGITGLTAAFALQPSYVITRLWHQIAR